MNFIRVILIICGLFGLTVSSSADQNDPRLNDLFAELKSATAPTSARVLEQQIWGIWLKTPHGTAQSLLDKGIERMHAGDLGTALAAFTHVVEAAPDFAEGWNKRATVYYLMEDFDASLEDIVKTLALEPRHFGALSGRGLIHIRLKNLKAALKAFEAALEFHPQATGAKSNADALRQILQKDI